MNKKKANINGLQITILAIVSLAVILAVGLYVLQEVQVAVEQGSNSAYTVASSPVTASGNATSLIITKLSNTPVWIGILIVVIFAAVVMMYFNYRE